MVSKNINTELRKPSGRGRPKKSEIVKPGGKPKTNVYEFDDDYLPTSQVRIVVDNPSTSRYPKRHPRRTENQCNGNIPLKEDAAAVQHQNSFKSGESFMSCNPSAEQITNTTASRRSSSPESENCSRVKVEKLTSNSLPGSTEKISIPHADTECTEGARSFNLTEVANDMNSHLADDEYVEQLMDPTLVNIEGYYVKHEVAELFQQIIRKYTSIGTSCAIKCGTTLGIFAEMICSVYNKLEKAHCLTDITATDLDGMFAIVNILENQKFDVKWLHERQKDISSMKHLIKDYRSLKKEVTQKAESIARKEKEISSAQAMLMVMKAELNKVIETKRSLRKGRTFWRKSLVHGLL